MSWQDSFVPDNAAPTAVQAQGWQSSFVPDSEANQFTGDNAAQVQALAPNVAEQNGEIGVQQQNSFPQKMYDYFSDKPEISYGDILPLSHNKNTDSYGLDFPELIRSPARGLAELLSRAGGEFPVQTDTSGRSLTGMGPDELNALTLLSPVSPASHSMAFGQQVANGIENIGGVVSDVLPDALIDEYTRTQQQTPIVTPKSGDLKLITQKLDLAGITPEQYAEALIKSGPDEFPAELGGDPLKIQAQTYARVQGPTMQTARDAMRQRLADAPQRVQSIIDTNVAPEPLIERMQNNISDLQSQLPDLYKAANKEIVPSALISDQLNTPAGKSAIQATAVKLANQGITPESAGFIKGSNGLYSLDENVPIKTLHEFSKSLGDQVVRNPLTGAIEDSNSLAIEGQRKGITSALSEASPTFAKANRTNAAVEQAQSAFDAGRKIAHAAAGDTADQLLDRAAQTYSPNELAYHRAGYAQGLIDKTSGATLGSGSPAARIANGNVINKTAEIFDSPSQAQSLSQALVREKQMMDFANRGLNNSVTAETASAALPDIPTSAHGIGLKVAEKIGDFLHKGQNERMSQFLYSLDPKDKSALADAIIRYRK